MADSQKKSPGSPAEAAIFLIDRNWIVKAVNKRAEECTGLKAAELIGRKGKDIFCTGPEDSSFEKLCRPVKEGHVFTNHPVLFHNVRTCLQRAFLASIIPVPDPEGQVAGAVICLQDPENSSYIHHLALESIVEGVVTVDEEWRITSFNRAAEKITGWRREEVEGRLCSEVFQSSICGEKCLLKKSMTDGCPNIDQPIFIKSKSGDSIPVSISSSPLLDDQGNVIGGIETFRDNTTVIRKGLILDSVADGVFTVDRNWKITSFNRAAEKITGWSRDDALGKSCSEVFHSSICGQNCAIAESLYSGRQISNRSIKIVNRQGKEVPVSISAAPLADHEGNIIGGVETFRDLTAITSLRQQLTKQYSFEQIVSRADSMQRLFKILPEIARSPSTVLITGESGTGKELVARAIYSASLRRDKPFVAVNCGALPETLLESELFGYKAGAFTDAKKDRAGRFAAAEGGTLFLDEIGDIPPSIQVKLLRVLQEKVYEPLGSNKPVRADVRIIAATNRDLKEMVKSGDFREDLYYRLNVVNINLPPLRERKEDIPLLVDHFIKKFSAEQGKDIVGIDPAALNQLMHYDYPGNIRELENIIEFSFILCEGGYIRAEHFPEMFRKELAGDSPAATGRAMSLEEIEREAILRALERNEWRKMATCRELGISKDTLRRKIAKYGLAKRD